MRNLIWQHHQQQHQKNINNNYSISTNSHQKVFRNIHRERPVLKFFFNKVSGLQPTLYQKRDIDTGLFIWNCLEHVFLVLLPRIIASQTIAPWMIDPDYCPRTIAPKVNCSQGKLPLENCHLGECSQEITPKIFAPSPQRKAVPRNVVPRINYTRYIFFPQ